RAWRALVRPGRRCKPGAHLRAGGVRLRVLGADHDGTRVIAREQGSIDALLDAHGLPPLPPYIARYAKPAPEDWERYQTVYAAALVATAARRRLRGPRGRAARVPPRRRHPLPLLLLWRRDVHRMRSRVRSSAGFAGATAGGRFGRGAEPPSEASYGDAMLIE